jgi:hypothetical protein
MVLSRLLFTANSSWSDFIQREPKAGISLSTESTPAKNSKTTRTQSKILKNYYTQIMYFYETIFIPKLRMIEILSILGMKILDNESVYIGNKLRFLIC